MDHLLYLEMMHQIQSIRRMSGSKLLYNSQKQPKFSHRHNRASPTVSPKRLLLRCTSHLEANLASVLAEDSWLLLCRSKLIWKLTFEFVLLVKTSINEHIHWSSIISMSFFSSRVLHHPNTSNSLHTKYTKPSVYFLASRSFIFWLVLGISEPQTRKSESLSERCRIIWMCRRRSNKVASLLIPKLYQPQIYRMYGLVKDLSLLLFCFYRTMHKISSGRHLHCF
jgi:hypothetical protein